MNYDTSVWYPATTDGVKTWTHVYNWGWRAQAEAVTGYLSFEVSSETFCTTYECNEIGGHEVCEYVDTGAKWTDTDFVYHDAFGVPHYFSGSANFLNGTCGTANPSLQSAATDGSGYILDFNNPTTGTTITDRYGKVIVPPTNEGIAAGSFTDRNGNQVTASSAGVFTDTLGTTALTVSGTPPSNTTFTYTAPSGANASYTMEYTEYTVKTNFGCSGIAEYTASDVPLVTKIEVPDGTAYTFTYEETPGTPGDVTGRLASYTLPTGGTISYTYTGSNNGIECADGSAAGLNRTINPGGEWQYVRSTSPTSTTTVSDPSTPSNQTVINFVGLYETERQIYQGSTSGTLLKTIYTCYNGATEPCNSTGVAAISQKTVTTQWPGTGGLESEVNATYNTYGLITEKDEYAYGTGSPGAIQRKTLTAYASLGNGIVSMPATVTVEDGGSNIKSQTTYTYDQGSATATSGTPQHVAITGSRGNATTVSSLVGGTTSLSKTFTYYDTGNVQTATDVNGGQTTYTYGTSSCGNSFATSVSEPLSLSRSMIWNCTGGVETSITDENSKTFSMAYSDTDFWRPKSSTDQESNVTNLSYNAQTSVEGSLVFGSASTSDALVTLDELGRMQVSQIKESPSSSTYDSVETDFDIVGRPSRKTLPYSATAGQTSSSAPGTSTTYDALNRKVQTSDTEVPPRTVAFSYKQNDTYRTLGPAPTGENTKQKQFEYDALGRLTSVCEITGATGSGSCAQTSPVTGYWTTYTYDVLNDLVGITQNAQSSGSQQARTYVYDGLGRMTSETNPESGTTSYTYDTDTTCGITSKGDLVKKIDAVGNTTCYAYDSLHRPTSMTYSGPYSSSTPNKYFVYDSATVNGVAMTNVKTRMADAYTATSSTGTKITDIGLSYSARGENSDVYESTPNSGGYYHTNATYWANGVLDVLTAKYGTSSITGLPTFTYGPDGEGRINTVSASAGQNPVTGTTYSVASLATQVSFGSSDNDSFTYDPNSNRMTQYEFTVNGQNVIGQLTWNPIGTLEDLVVTDPFFSGGNQSCAYTHDDLIRIASANCGTSWSQTFSYDAFGNISKSGTVSFQATYSHLTNQMTQVGSSVPTYDANGNATNDTAHTYTWDASGRPVNVDGVGLTYDALGRMVEQNKSGTYYQIVYTPAGGKFAIMNAATLQKAFVPLAGGSQAIYTSSGLAYYRHSDWIGSSRFASTPSRTTYYDGAYAPFGEAYAQTGTADLSFTGMNQDTVANLYDFPARELNDIHGRWPSPDPAGLSSTNKNDPQMWNRYAYARNSPLHITDPTGMYLGDAFDSLYDGDDGVVGATCYMCGGYNAPAFWASGDLDLYGDLYYDIPGNQGLGQAGAEGESRHVSIMTDGWDPELGIDQDTTQYWFDNAPDNAYENQKEFDAVQLGETACAGGDAGDIASCIQQVYDTMGDANGAPSSLVGGNYNFSYANVTIDGQSLDPSSLGDCADSIFGDRCGYMPSIHFDPSAETFHVDTANPLNFPIGTAFHLVVDYILGNTALSSGIPR
jgi:RHS repeat-associated protein